MDRVSEGGGAQYKMGLNREKQKGELVAKGLGKAGRGCRIEVASGGRKGVDMESEKKGERC